MFLCFCVSPYEIEFQKIEHEVSPVQERLQLTPLESSVKLAPSCPVATLPL